MKKLILSSLLALITTIGFSHGLVNKCWANGRYTIEIVDGPVGGNIHVTTNSGFDTTFNITTNHQLFTVPQPNRLNPVHVFGTYSDGITNQITTNSTQCTVLAIKEVSVTSNVNLDGDLEIWITVDDDTDVSNYRITDRRTGKVYQIIIPDKRQGRKTYYILLKQ